MVKMINKIDNKFVKRLYEMKIGGKVQLNIGESDEGTFIRVPSGWIYRYVSRNNCTSCFIPYTEEIRYWDSQLDIKPCKCGSTEVFLIRKDDTSEKWCVQCDSCMASSSMRKDRTDAIKSWNEGAKK